MTRKKSPITKKELKKAQKRRDELLAAKYFGTGLSSNEEKELEYVTERVNTYIDFKYPLPVIPDDVNSFCKMIVERYKKNTK